MATYVMLNIVISPWQPGL